MDTSIISLLIAAVPPTIVALGTLIVSIKNGKKADGIHILVNSNLTAVKDALTAANKRIEALEAIIVAIQGKAAASIVGAPKV